MSTKIRQPKAKFGELAMKAGVITLEQLNAALQKQLSDGPWRALGDVLIGMGVCTKADIDMVLEVQAQLQSPGGYDAASECEANSRELSGVVELRAMARKER